MRVQLSSNRTLLELKFMLTLTYDDAHGSNRTLLELKSANYGEYTPFFVRSNRTLLELK